MGTTFTVTFSVRTPAQRKEEIDKNFFADRYSVVRSCMVGNIYYAAVKDNDSEEVFAAVIRTFYDKNQGFGYKEATESLCPCEKDCPKSVLDLLTPTEDDNAKEWRKECYERIRHKNLLRRLKKNGATIAFHAPFDLMSGVRQGEVINITYGRTYSGKKAWYYPDCRGLRQILFPERYIPMDFNIVYIS